MEMQLLAARKCGGGKGWREQAALSQWWKSSELQGLLFICSIAREILRDVCLSPFIDSSPCHGWEEPPDTVVEGAER